MARLWTAGAEAQSLAADSLTLQSSIIPTFDATIKRSGGFAFKYTSTTTSDMGSSYTLFTGALANDYFFRAHIYLSALPTAAAPRIIVFATGGGAALFSVRLTSAGKFQLANQSNVQIGSDSTTAISAGQWYRLEVRGRIDTGAIDQAEVLLDGTQILSATAQSFSDTAPGRIYTGGWFDTPGASGVSFYLDDLAINDSTGADQASWPGDGNIVLLLPTSDNARATLWTGGVGGTTNLYDAVNNTPPIGTASETDLTQIEHAGGAAGTTDAYDANMTTYTAAGLAAIDTINVVQPVFAHGEDISTGTKLLNISVVSNPAIAASANFAAGHDAGLLGTYPTAWATDFGLPSYAPAVTLGTAPVMRVTRPETANRVASVCYMGMLVEYVPGVAAASLPPIRRPNVLARR